MIKTIEMVETAVITVTIRTAYEITFDQIYILLSVMTVYWIYGL
jgi:regulation of enolase protein 1 (concanavalin A-like superfamily)